ncbi:MAG: flagellar biosynthetic protein FliO [Phycisphaeraceae bacterium]|nr:flagellar biosynthetic protein FliO [Phycisphaeraceae bacterium]
MATWRAAATCVVAVNALVSVGAADAPPSLMQGPPEPTAVQRAAEREARQGFGSGVAAVEGRPAPTPDQPGAAVTLGSVALPLAMVLGLIVLGAAVLRKVAVRRASLATALGPGAPAPGGLLEVLGRYPVSRSQALVLLKVDRRVLLLSHTQPGRAHGGGFATLAEIVDPEEVASMLLKADQGEGRAMSDRFREALNQADLGQTQVEPTPAGRRVNAAADGDRVELWDEGAGVRPAEPPAGAEMFPDPVVRLRRRLSAMRSGAAEGGR